MLSLNNLELKNFRSYKNFKLNHLEDTVIFLGDNAAGKTNIIEAIYLICSLNSFRNATLKDLIYSGQNGQDSPTYIKSNIVGDNRSLDLEIKLQSNKKEIFLNSKKKSTREIKSIIPAIVFTPDDLVIVKGGHKLRRQELDRLGCQLNTSYKQVSLDYNKLLHQKNYALKNNAKKTTIYAINDVFATVGERLLILRKALFERLTPLIQKHFYELSSQLFCLEQTYKSSYEGALIDKINSCYFDEINKGRAVVGPHLDEICFKIDGFEASRCASQGQQRMLTLAIKLAEVDLIEQMLGQPPVLLLDDVMSELDEQKRNALLSLINGNIQTFITTANFDYFPSSYLKNIQIINL